MPVGPYDTFAQCVAAMNQRGYSDDTARRICGAMETRRITRAAESQQPQMRLIYERIIRHLRQSVTQQTTFDAVAFGVEIGFPELPPDIIAAAMRTLDEAVIAGALDEAQQWPLELDVRHPAIIGYAETRAAGLITSITEESRQAIRNVIARAVARGDNPIIAAREIRNLVGLTQGHATAVDRFFRRALARDVPLNLAQRNAAAYADRLIAYRARNIARTEILSAANFGQLEYWQQLGEAGLINVTVVEREWIVSDDDRLCPQCAPMAGVRVRGLDGPFESINLGLAPNEWTTRDEAVFVDYPPLHPSCRCTIALVA